MIENQENMKKKKNKKKPEKHGDAFHVSGKINIHNTLLLNSLPDQVG